MDFGGLLHADDPELEVMHCREGSVFSYTRGIGDPGTRWTHAQAAATFGQIEPWHSGHHQSRGGCVQGRRISARRRAICSCAMAGSAGGGDFGGGDSGVVATLAVFCPAQAQNSPRMAF